MSKLSRTKGATYERSKAVQLREVYPGAKRGIGQARAAGECPDIDGTPWWAELKHRKVVNVFDALEQAEKDTDGRPPLVIARRGQKAPGVEAPDIAALRLTDFLKLLVELEQLRARDRAERSAMEIPDGVGGVTRFVRNG